MNKKLAAIGFVMVLIGMGISFYNKTAMLILEFYPTSLALQIYPSALLGVGVVFVGMIIFILGIIGVATEVIETVFERREQEE